MRGVCDRPARPHLHHPIRGPADQPLGMAEARHQRHRRARSHNHRRRHRLRPPALGAPGAGDEGAEAACAISNGACKPVEASSGTGRRGLGRDREAPHGRPLPACWKTSCAPGRRARRVPIVSTPRYTRSTPFARGTPEPQRTSRISVPFPTRIVQFRAAPCPGVVRAKAGHMSRRVLSSVRSTGSSKNSDRRRRVLTRTSAFTRKQRPGFGPRPGGLTPSPQIGGLTRPDLANASADVRDRDGHQEVATASPILAACRRV